MLKIGNIVYKDELVNHTKVDYINYYNVDGEFNDYDRGLPTLIVGWNFLKDNNQFYELNILEKEITKNVVYWEFSFNENKAQHVSGVEMFIRNTPYYYFRDKYKYKNVDPIFENFETIQDLKNIMPNNVEFVYNYKNEGLYFLNEDMIYGIDLNMYEFFNIEKDEIINSVVSETTPYAVDLEGEIYQKHYKNYPNFEELKRYLVVLLSKG